MLSTDKLKEFATKKQTTELNIRREYIQHVFLSYFYQQPQTKKIFFKGGTALRFIYNSPRFSEDLDFSSFIKVGQIEDAVQNTLFEIEREGIKTEVTESKKTSGGYLAIISFQLFQEKLTIQLEISFRDRPIKGEVITIVNDFLPSYTLVSLIEKQLVGQKIRALLSRQKARDFYDLYFILRANLLPLQERSILPKVFTLLSKSNLLFKKELRQFLPKSNWAIIDKFKPALEKEIKKFI